MQFLTKLYKLMKHTKLVNYNHSSKVNLVQLSKQFNIKLCKIFLVLNLLEIKVWIIRIGKQSRPFLSIPCSDLLWLMVCIIHKKQQRKKNDRSTFQLPHYSLCSKCKDTNDTAMSSHHSNNTDFPWKLEAVSEYEIIGLYQGLRTTKTFERHSACLQVLR